MRNATLVCLAVAAAAWTRPASAQIPPAESVAEVRVAGNKHMSADAVLSHVKTRAGARYDESVTKEDERRLLQTGRFDTVEVTKTPTPAGVIVTYVVRERPTVAKLQFEGNKALTNEHLAKELTFGVGDAVNPVAIEAGRQAILNKYRATGRHFATVELDAAAVKENRVVYRIVEGPEVTIRKIRFEGNRHFTNFRLNQTIATSKRFWPFVPGYLDSEQLERDVHALRNLYVSEGFLDAEVARKPLEFSADKTKVILTFVVKEGPRYRIAGLQFVGNTVFSRDELAKRLQLQPGKFFNALSLRRDVKALEDTYGELGYIEATVKADKVYKETPGTVDLKYTVVERDQYHIGRIDIRGNSVTQTRIIRRDLGFFPEQLYNTVAVDESKKRLEEARLFEKVEITPVGREPKSRDVLVHVVEGKTAEFLVGAGISSNSGLLGNVTLTQRNFDLFGWPKSWRQFITGQSFKGAGQTFRIVAEPGTELMRFHVEWFEPALMDQPYSLGTKAFFFTRGREDYDETRYGGLVSVGHRFKNRWYGELSPRIEMVEIDSLDSDAPPEVVKEKGQNLLVGLKGTLVRDRTDSRWRPTTGDRFRLSYEQVGGDWTFGRATGEYKIFRTVYVDPLDRKHVLAGRLAAGNLFGDAPTFERFYGGGIGSIRGFKYRGISPRSKGTDKPIGGDFMVFAGAEYEFPLIGDQISGVFFLDSGTVEEDAEITTYRASTGFGIRWVIPFMGPVPLSLDFGVPISKHSDDDTQLVSFSLGWTF